MSDLKSCYPVKNGPQLHDGTVMMDVVQESIPLGSRLLYFGYNNINAMRY